MKGIETEKRSKIIIFDHFSRKKYFWGKNQWLFNFEKLIRQSLLNQNMIFQEIHNFLNFIKLFPRKMFCLAWSWLHNAAMQCKYRQIVPGSLKNFFLTSNVTVQLTLVICWLVIFKSTIEKWFFWVNFSLVLLIKPFVCKINIRLQ